MHVTQLSKHIAPGVKAPIVLSLGESDIYLVAAGPNITALSFQEGTVKDAGLNGLTIEALLAVCIHRLEGFQTTEYACKENEAALEHLEGALAHLHMRTARRVAEGTEGMLTNVS